MAEIRRVTQLPPRTLSRRLSEKRKEYDGLIDDAQAAALFAAAKGIRIAKYTTPAFREGLTNLTRIRAPSPTVVTTEPPARARQPRQVNVRIDTEVGERVPFIDADVERSAKEMGHAYPYFYLFENSVRGLVVSRMDAAFSGGWWDESHIAKEIVRDAAARMTKEKRHRWHATRGGHPIYYTDFDNLRSIISRHWTSVFEPDLGDVTIVQAMFTEMEELRNIVAHNNPLEAHDLERLQSNFRTWVRQLRAVANPRAAMAPSTK